MKHLTISTLLAATLALAPVAPASAQMSNEQINQLLLGLAAVGVTGVAIDKLKDRKDDKKEEKVKQQRGQYDYRSPHRKRTLPARCVDIVEGRRGNVRRVLSKRCLERNVRHVDRLPRRCEREVYAFGRHHDVYGVRCLKDFGWTVARHH